MARWHLRRLFHISEKTKMSFIICFTSVSFTLGILHISGLLTRCSSKDHQSTDRYQMNPATKNPLINSFDSTSAECCSPPCWDRLENVDTLTASQIMQYFLWTNRSSCQLAYDFGGVLITNPSGMEGQKAVCIDPKIAPLPADCIIYSFGISDDWSFDEAMGRYGCEVFAFDPSLNLTEHDHTPAIHFYDWGLGRVDENRTYKNTIWKMRTLSTIYETLAHRHGRVIIDYLKIDIEFAEWDTIPQIVESGMLSKVRQLGVEFHMERDKPIEKYREYAKLLWTLEKHGMVRFDSKYNPWYVGEYFQLNLAGAYGYEIAWYNSKLQHPILNLMYVDFLNNFKQN